jgi:hypothetical protein
MSQSTYQIAKSPNYQILTSALLLVLFSAVLILLQSRLRADSFFVGDPGIKLIAAKNAIARPDHPLDIPLPVIGRETLPYVEPFFEVHGDHVHAVTTDLFPLVSARAIHWFGLRGAYILPAASALILLTGCAWLALVLDSRRNPAVVLVIAGVATPFLFYGLEFWEHMPAVAAATIGTALLAAALRGRKAGTSMALAAGLAFGVAILLRPESALTFVAVLLASMTIEHGSANRTRLIGGSIAAAAVTLVPLEIYTLGHFGRVMPAHLWANAGLLQGSWITERGHLIAAWFLPSRWTASGPVRSQSFWMAAPVVLLACVPIPADASRDGRRFLWTTAVLVLVLVFLTAPNDGGGQWTPRYLLFVYVPLVILAADAVEALPRRAATATALALLLLASLWTQRAAYRELRGAKSTYGQVVDFVAKEAAPGGWIVSDLWWLDQIAASATSERRLMYVPNPADAHAVMQRLSRAVVPIVTVIRSESESPDTGAWRDDTCYVEIKRDRLQVRRLVAITLHHRCSH